MIALTAFTLIFAGMAMAHWATSFRPILIGPFYLDELIPRKCD